MIKYLLLFLSILTVSCTGTKKIAIAPEEIEERFLDTLMVVAPKIIETDSTIVLEPYHASSKRTIDILHTKLDLKFNWEDQHVLGIAEIKLKPFLHPIDEVSFDAVGFEIHKVLNSITNLPLDYEYNGKVLTILLEKEYSNSDIVIVSIDYTAKPEELPEGGSAAITSDKGLFFINPLGEDPEKPMQIWTQGETENNSRWFPTIDKPNERCTQETILTVNQKYKTLSNGKLISSTNHQDGTRTDHWSMEQPHPPYLFMIAIGEFAVVEDTWEDIPISYYVEPKYEKDAKLIFNHTPEMLSFFSEYTGIHYPWDKFSQIIVRDYVSGAMENTTAVIFGEFIQKTARELIDDDNDYIVAHEMFHHWFGDYVTCESWSNLTLNEGFANYSEYLWSEYKYGKETADYQRYNELRGYLNSTQNGGTHDLIDFAYQDKEMMFDAHSYNKGGLVLHMLRNYVGHDVFRKSLNHYLKQNALSSVEAHNLRLAFEEITGEDLNWFFNQWFYDKGHPRLEVNHNYSNETYTLTVKQTQNIEANAAIFQLPINVQIFYVDGTSTIKPIWINKREQVFTFDVKEKPALVNFDSDNILLGIVQENLSTQEYIYQYQNSSDFQDRYDALIALKGIPEAKGVFEAAINDNFFALRRLAINEINPSNDNLVQKLRSLAENDPKSQVRTAALNKLSNTNNPSLVAFAEKIIQKEQSYDTYSTALSIIFEMDQEKGLIIAESLLNEDNFAIVSQLSEIFAFSNDGKYADYFEKKILKIEGYNSYPLFGNYLTFLLNLKYEDLLKKEDFLIGVGKNNSSTFKRFMATITLNNLKQNVASIMEAEKNEEQLKIQSQIVEKTDNAIKEIIELEKNPQLLERYSSF